MPSGLKAAFAALGVASIALGACSNQQLGQGGRFGGFAVADEPRAVKTGHAVLASGGNAVDAAVAMSFTLAVTLPSRAGLGGGGVCVLNQRAEKKQTALLFLPGVGRNGAAVPALARGLAALHARYGKNRWAGLIRPAERMAAFGHGISRAFRKDLSRAAPDLSEAARAVFLDDGTLPEVGDKRRQPALGTVLAGLRQRGAGYMNTGDFARNLVEAAKAVGHDLTLADLRAEVPRFTDPVAMTYGDHRLFLPPWPVSGGQRVARAWPAFDASGLAKPGSAARWQRLLRAWDEAGGDDRESKTVPPRDIPAGLAVADGRGNMVACSFTMNGLFGSGDMAQGTGLLMARPEPAVQAGQTLLPAVAANIYTGRSYLAASFHGDAVPGVMLMQTLARLSDSGGVATPVTDVEAGPVARSKGPQPAPYERAEAAEAARKAAAADVAPLMRVPRLTPLPAGRQLRHESNLPSAIRDGLREAGYDLKMVRSLGRVVLVHCPRGARDGRAGCAAAADPRGHGMAMRALAE